MSDPATIEKRASIGARRNPATHEAVLDAAEALLRESGLAGFSIEGVARRARAGKPTIYRWWPTKTQLLLDVYQRLKLNIRPPDTGTIEGDCLAFLVGLLGYWRQGPGQVFRSIFAEAQTDERAAEALRAYTADRRANTARIFERAKARGELRPDADAAVAAEIIAAFAWSRLLTGRLDADEAELRPVVQQMVRGMLA
ncbi:MAG TPA: TetR/AcrR family transcriptional regulator [Devosia sp.]